MGRGRWGRGQKGGEEGQEEGGFHRKDVMKCLGGHMECLGGMRLQSFLTLFTRATPGTPASNTINALHIWFLLVLFTQCSTGTASSFTRIAIIVEKSHWIILFAHWTIIMNCIFIYRFTNEAAPTQAYIVHCKIYTAVLWVTL